MGAQNPYGFVPLITLCKERHDEETYPNQNRF